MFSSTNMNSSVTVLILNYDYYYMKIFMWYKRHNIKKTWTLYIIYYDMIGYTFLWW